MARHHGPDASPNQVDFSAPAASPAVEAGARRTARCATCKDTGTCRACAQLRRRAWMLVRAQGLAVEQAAAQMKLTVAQTRRFVALHDDWLELESLKQNTVSAQAVLAVLYAEQRRDPGLTRAEIARRMGRTQSQLDRMLGLASAKRSADPARRRVNVASASALMRALGRAPTSSTAADAPSAGRRSDRR